MVRRNKNNHRQMLDVISSIIKNDFIPSDQSQMVETHTKGKKGSMSCKICCKDEEILLCSFDKKGENCKLFPYFNQVDGMVSMCDYILFVESEAELFVFSIDLKDTTNSPKQQTVISNTFAEFIINRIRTVMGEDSFPKQVEYRQVGIKTTQEKMTTKGYAQLCYNDGYVLLPDYHYFYTTRLMDLSCQ